MGGIARRGIYDNMKTAVDKVKKGKGRTVNKRFAAMCTHYLVDADFCNVASGWEKGVIEKNVQDSRRRIWIDAAKLRFGSFVELNAWLGDRCRALWDEVRYTEHEQVFAIDTPASRMNKGYAEDTASARPTFHVVSRRPTNPSVTRMNTGFQPNSLRSTVSRRTISSHQN